MNIPTPVLTAIRAGWQYESSADALEIVSVSAIPAGELAAIHRESGGCAELADALDAQWQNHVGEEISVDELEKIAHLQTRIFVRQLSELGLPVGALMTKRLLLG